MGWGSIFSDTLATVQDAGATALQALGSAADTAAAKAADLAARAKAAAADAAVALKNEARAAAQAAVDRARATRDMAVQAGQAAWGAGQVAARKVGAVGVLAGDVALAGGVAGAGAVGVAGAKAYGTVADTYRKVKEQFSPSQPVARPCLPCLAADSAEARKARIEKRHALIAEGEQSKDPAARASAAQLREDMKAVELARLSENTYAQYDPEATPQQKKPPEPWKALSPAEAQAMGLPTDMIKRSQAVIYTAPSDFPFEPKTVVAFRGTTAEAADILTDHDQALGMATDQYEAAQNLGKALRDASPDAMVTGHSLGGGKAQAAGIAAGLKGQMFNSAGLHPKSMGLPADGLLPFTDNFIQYRADGGLAQGGGDPLTGLQNSPTAQKVAYGVAQGLQALGRANQWALNELGIHDPLGALPEAHQPLAREMAQRLLNVTPQEAARNHAFSNGQWYVPPALGEVRGLTSKAADGNNSSIPAQHSITNLVYGFEHRKAGDIQALLADTGKPGEVRDYVGPVVVK